MASTVPAEQRPGEDAGRQPAPTVVEAARPAPAVGIPDWALAAITAVVALPIAWLGYGTDLDIGDVLNTGALIRSGDYAPSRNPGVPVVESIVAVLDPIGGHVLVNLATAAALAVTVVSIARLVRAWGHRNGDLVALAFLASPIALISGTQTADFVYALAFLMAGAVVHVEDRPVASGVLFALALGSRSSTALVLAAFLVADAWDRTHRRRALVALAVALPLAALLYIPAWLSADRTTAFLATTDNWEGLRNNLGRSIVKNFSVAGVPMLLVLAAAVPAMLRSLGRWGRDPLVRFAVLALLASEALFLWVPWKPAHLLPALLAVLCWVAATDRSRRYLWILVAAVALNGIVTFRPLLSDNPDAADGFDFAPALTLGWLLNDIRCRADYMHDPPRMDSGAWACTLIPMRGPVIRPSTP
jgi:hypothetical protein